MEIEEEVRLKIPKLCADYKPKAPNTQAGKPAFDTIDNPGNWPSFVFEPQFKGSGQRKQYLHHALPIGCTPKLPARKDGKQTVAGWELGYDGWTLMEDGILQQYVGELLQKSKRT